MSHVPAQVDPVEFPAHDELVSLRHVNGVLAAIEVDLKTAVYEQGLALAVIQEIRRRIQRIGYQPTPPK